MMIMLFLSFLLVPPYFHFPIDNGIYCELNQSQCITYIISASNNKKQLKVLEESIKKLPFSIKPVSSSVTPLESFSTSSYNFNNQLTYGYLACSRKYYITRNVSLLIINENDSHNNDNSINDHDSDNKKIIVNKNLIDKISAETVNRLMIIENCDE